MNIVATIANAAQLAIILAVFFIRGLDLGALVIFLLFLLMPIPFINFLALFFCHRPMGPAVADERRKNGLIKREAMRVNYGADYCPILETRGTAFVVRDLSEGGVRIRASAAIHFSKKVNGEIQLISGERIRFKATLLRREESEVVFQFTQPIGTAVLMLEKKAMSVDNSS